MRSGISQLSKSSFQIDFIYQGYRCREQIKIAADDPDWKHTATVLRAAIMKDIADGTFDYIKRFPNSARAYRVMGRPLPLNFRKRYENCPVCGRLIETSRKRKRTETHVFYCSKSCANRSLGKYGLRSLPEWAITLMDECRKRAFRKKLEFSLTTDEFRTVLFRSGWRCELSGIEFEFEQSTRRGPHRPFSPSLDRIDSMKGYTIDNVRLVCLAVNIAMNTWGENVLFAIAKGVVNQQGLARS